LTAGDSAESTSWPGDFAVSVIEWLESVLPDGAACAGGGLLGSSDAPLFTVEEMSVARAVRKRQTEFRTGRAYARAALAALGCSPGPIPVGESRQPVWPNGFLGSISHSGQTCVCVVGRSKYFSGLGLDLELDEKLEGDLFPLICREDERGLKQNLSGTGIDLGKLLFVMKEAVYKAYFPSAGIFLDFHDVKVEIDPARAAFVAFLVNSTAPCLAGSRHLAGRYAHLDQYLIALIAVPT
jgi:4'-phosphopantetheinyl transferase EntD